MIKNENKDMSMILATESDVLDNTKNKYIKNIEAHLNYLQSNNKLYVTLYVEDTDGYEWSISNEVDITELSAMMITPQMNFIIDKYTELINKDEHN